MENIASQGAQNNAVMKSIAFLTMLFLPATSVAILFTMPVLEWDANEGSSVITDRFWVCWAVTLPLTAVALGARLLWMWYSAGLGAIDRKCSAGRIRCEGLLEGDISWLYERRPNFQ